MHKRVLKVFITAGEFISVQNTCITFILYREINKFGDVLKLMSGNCTLNAIAIFMFLR